MRCLAHYFLLFLLLILHIEGKKSKISFMFLTRGPMPMEDIWHEFFRWNADPTMYNIYVHPAPGYIYPNTSVFYGKEVKNRKPVKWASWGIIEATITLLKSALADDPENEWFCLLSEACIPLASFSKFSKTLLKGEKSIINACAMDPKVTEIKARWHKSLDGLFPPEAWRKSSEWFAIRRKHAEVIVKEYNFTNGFHNVPCVDEHYPASVIAYNGLDNETTCNDGYAHVFWPSAVASHPYTYSADEITTDLFTKRLQVPSTGSGHINVFGSTCSGYDICHFVARKFSVESRYHLLDYMDIILADDEHTYSDDPYRLVSERLRYRMEERDVKSNTTDAITKQINKVYYVIDCDTLREIPVVTLNVMHLDSEVALPLQADELMRYPFGHKFFPVDNGLFIKVKDDRRVYYIKDGKKHLFPNFDTFLAYGGRPETIWQIPHGDFQSIPEGEEISPVETPPK